MLITDEPLCLLIFQEASDARLVGRQTFHADPIDGHRRVIAVVVAVGYRRGTLMSAASAPPSPRRRRQKETLESLPELNDPHEKWLNTIRKTLLGEFQLELTRLGVTWRLMPQ